MGRWTLPRSRASSSSTCASASRACFLAGTCGEGPLMPNAQRDKLVKTVKRLAGKRLHIAVQVSDTSAARVCDNIRRAQDAGGDSIVIAPPWLMRFANKGFVQRYFTEPTEFSPLPVGIYCLKQAAGSALELPMWTEVASHPKVSFIKDSSSTPEYMKDSWPSSRSVPGLS